jgi:hypothetical protein
MLRHLCKDPLKDQSFVRRLAKWRQGQAKLMPHVAARVLAEESDTGESSVSFYLPSDLSDNECTLQERNFLTRSCPM